VTWAPSRYLNDSTLATPVAKPLSDIKYKVFVVDNYGCKNSDSMMLRVFAPKEISVTPETDSIVIGDTVFIKTTYNHDGLVYSWSPPDGLQCSACPAPWAHPLNTTNYSLLVTDSVGCPAME